MKKSEILINIIQFTIVLCVTGAIVAAVVLAGAAFVVVSIRNWAVESSSLHFSHYLFFQFNPSLARSCIRDSFF